MSVRDIEAQVSLPSTGGDYGSQGIESAKSLIVELAEQLKKLERECNKVGSRRDCSDVRASIETGLIPNCNSIRDQIEQQRWGAGDHITQNSKLHNDFQMLKNELNALEKEYRASRLKHPLKSERVDHGAVTKVIRGDPESSYLSIQVDEQTPLLQEREETQQQQLQQQQEQQQQQQQQVNVSQDEVDFHTIILRERSQQVTRIHSAVQEVNAIFHQLGSLVDQQGDQVDEVDANIGQLASNMQKANDQLNRADQHQRKKNRCGLMALVVMVVAVLIVTLAVLS
ncbi:ZYBA0S12-01068g1_1 [Zygosaccharomyces bailii CLIB 213]|uniref:ZYBA0S12-01068g1_1 n=1 Tax=Zygosaccharomyces bailii (strain CLIB 213 / ATCC 58445 / CBS 680 / BCRC 21525 / NBRC 1098 / NCYC 1416 / NRRL Y-2227) TaxID=1333698 RepID=A0A8J2TAL3_ZYGB2|nr:ZYBA0S12-01068g1_1 [Zygosaccharomyces bailii CLIB 213]